MCVTLSAGLLRCPRAAARAAIQQRATYIHSKPPKHEVGAAESALALTVMTLCVLGPCSWILSHLGHYNSRGIN